MTETDLLMWLLTLFVGIGLGAFFFGGLWYTVGVIVRSARPARWLVLGLSLRVGVTVAGFYLIALGDWRRLPLCLVGFLLARVAASYLARSPTTGPPP